MKQEGRIYTADKGNFIVRKRDGFIMGDGICLGTQDTIDNYEEREFTKEEIEEFFRSIGMETIAEEGDA
jgi:hypothetical protein